MSGPGGCPPLNGRELKLQLTITNLKRRLVHVKLARLEDDTSEAGGLKRRRLLAKLERLDDRATLVLEHLKSSPHQRGGRGRHGPRGKCGLPTRPHHGRHGKGCKQHLKAMTLQELPSDATRVILDGRLLIQGRLLKPTDLASLVGDQTELLVVLPHHVGLDVAPVPGLNLAVRRCAPKQKVGDAAEQLIQEDAQGQTAGIVLVTAHAPLIRRGLGLGLGVMHGRTLKNLVRGHPTADGNDAFDLDDENSDDLRDCDDFDPADLVGKLNATTLENDEEEDEDLNLEEEDPNLGVIAYDDELALALALEAQAEDSDFEE